MRSFQDQVKGFNRGLRRDYDNRRSDPSLVRLRNMRTSPDGLEALMPVYDPFEITDSGLGLGAWAAGYRTLDDTVLITDNGLEAIEGGGGHQAGGYVPGGVDSEIPAGTESPGYDATLLDVIADYEFLLGTEKWDEDAWWSYLDHGASYDPLSSANGIPSGSTLVSNGSLAASITGWSAYSATSVGFHGYHVDTVDPAPTGRGHGVVNNTADAGGIQQTVSIVANQWYLITWSVGGDGTSISSLATYAHVGGQDGDTTQFTGPGTYTQLIQAPASPTNTIRIVVGVAGDGGAHFWLADIEAYVATPTSRLIQPAANLVRPLVAGKVYKLTIEGTILNHQVWHPAEIVHTPEEIRNPSFTSNLSGWEAVSASSYPWQGGGYALLENGGYVRQRLNLVSGQAYKVRLYCLIQDGSLTISLGLSASSKVISTVGDWARYEFVLTAGTDEFGYTGIKITASQMQRVDNISIFSIEEVTEGYWSEGTNVASLDMNLTVGDDTQTITIRENGVVEYTEYFQLSGISSTDVELSPAAAPADYTSVLHGGPLVRLDKLRLQETALTEVP